MRHSPFIILLVCLLTTTGAMAQNEEDVLRYSTPQIIGTARYVGMAGAYGAIGADFSSISTNPAGLGLYKKSEFTITPSINFSNTESAYQGTTMDDGRNRFALGNVGVVLTGAPANR
ncbi:TonB-dependent receptor, partial [Candidatus Falkowbacteria bacterium]|nr:TonB-dependent receptor [Candidatus Falkowbacteria bacterium]